MLLRGATQVDYGKVSSLSKHCSSQYTIQLMYISPSPFVVTCGVDNKITLLRNKIPNLCSCQAVSFSLTIHKQVSQNLCFPVIFTVFKCTCRCCQDCVFSSGFYIPPTRRIDLLCIYWAIYSAHSARAQPTKIHVHTINLIFACSNLKNYFLGVQAPQIVVLKEEAKRL